MSKPHIFAARYWRVTASVAAVLVVALVIQQLTGWDTDFVAGYLSCSVVSACLRGGNQA